MKRLISLALSLVAAVLVYAGNPVSVKAGKPTVFNVVERCTMTVDYSKTKVSDKKGELSIDEYLKSRGEDFVKDWPNDKVKALEYFKVRFNKKFKKGLQIVSNADDAKYKMILHVDRLDMGNGGSMFIPMASSKAGGVILNGTLDVIDVKAGKYVCRLRLDDVKGTGHVSETVRLGLCYFELATYIYKLAKKEKGEVEFCGDVERPVVKKTIVSTAEKNIKSTVKKTAVRKKTPVRRSAAKRRK